MTRLSNSHVIAYINETSHIIGEIFVDEVSELPTADGIDGYELVQGSIAYVIHSGKFYVMDSDGKWCSSEDGTVVEIPESSVTETQSGESENSVDSVNESDGIMDKNF